MALTVAIIGGGISGLYAAWRLERALDGANGRAPDIHVLERAGRLGGRIRTDRFDEHGLHYEAGAAELYDINHAPALRDLVDALGFERLPVLGTPIVQFEDRILRDEADYEKELGAEAIRHLDRFWAEGTSLRTPWSYAAAGHPQDNGHPWAGRSFDEVLGRIPDARARRFTEIQVHSDLATEPPRTNGTFGFDNLLIDHPDYCSLYTIPGGHEGIVRRLAEETCASVETSCRVKSVEALAERRFRVSYRNGDGAGERALEADAVIVTPPASQLDRIGWNGPGLDEAIRDHVAHHEWWTDYLRVTLLFARRFWTHAFPEHYFVSEAFGGVTVYDLTAISRQDGEKGILSWLIAGEEATRLAARTDREIVPQVLASLPAPLAASASEILLDTRVDRWTGENGVSRQPGGRPLQSLEERHRPSPQHPTLFVTGDYLYDATINGACEGVNWVVTTLAAEAGASEARPPATPEETPWIETGRDEGYEATAETAGRLPFLKEAVETDGS